MKSDTNEVTALATKGRAKRGSTFLRLPVRVHLFLLVVLAVLPALAGILYMGASQRQRVHRNIRENALTTANLVAGIQERKSESTRQLLATLAQLPEVKKHSSESLNLLLADLLEKNEDFLNLLVADADGLVFASALPSSSFSISDRKYFQEAIASRGFSVGEFTVSRTAIRPTLHFAYPAIDAANNVQAVVVAAFNTALYQKFFAQAGLTGGAALSLIDHRGIVLFAAQPHERSIGQFDPPELFGRMQGPAREGVFESLDESGRTRYYAYRKLFLRGADRPYLFVRIGIPPWRALREVDQVTRGSLALLTLASIAALGCVWVLGEVLILRRLRLVLSASRQIAEGDLKVRVGLEDQRGELAELGHTFDLMAESLERRSREQEQVQAKLRASEEQYRSLFNTMMTAFSYQRIICDESGQPVDSCILDVNPAYEAATGLKRHEVVGRTVREIFPNLEDFWIEAYGKVALTGQPLYFQNYHGGLTCYLDTYMYSPSPMHVAVLSNDITERRAAEEALLEERERMAVTLASIGDAVFSTDPLGRIVLMNRVAEEYSGWSAAEAIGSPIDQVLRLFDPETGQSLSRSQSLAQLAAPARMASIRGRLLSRQGVERLVIHAMAPLRGQENQNSGWVVVLHDITAESRVQEEMQRSAKLESIGIMAGGIAHDFNNLLTAMSGNISLAQAIMDPGNRSCEYLRGVEIAVTRARELTQQLLTFAKGGAPIKRVVSLTDLLHSSAQFVLSGSTHLLQFNSPGDLWPANVDEGQITQVLNNLVINAVQSMKRSGVVTVALENVQVSSAQAMPIEPGPYVKVSVTDQGEGIPAEIRDRVFDPFFTTKAQGSGLGLTSSYSIIKAHGGYLQIEDSSPAGTTISFYLPATPGGKIEPRGTIRLQDVTPKRVLVMDDEAIVRELLQDMLQALGHSVVCVEDGEKAIREYQAAMAKPEAYDVVILDLTIRGGMGGKEVIKELLSLDPQVRAIATSGYSTDAVMSEYETFGFVSRLVKPYQVQELQRALAEACSHPTPGSA